MPLTPQVVRRCLATAGTLAALLGLFPGEPTMRAADAAVGRGEWLVDQRDDAANPDRPLPAFLDLRRLRLRTETLTWGGRPARDVVVVVVDTANGPGAYPARTTLQVHLAFGRQPVGQAAAPPPRPDVTLTLRMTEGRAGGGRRRAPAGEQARAVARFDGVDGLGSLSSFESGRSVTFRVPLDTLWRQATTEQQRAAADGQGGWHLRVWAAAEGPDGHDILPRHHAANGGAPAAPVQLLLPLPGS